MSENCYGPGHYGVSFLDSLRFSGMQKGCREDEASEDSVTFISRSCTTFIFPQMLLLKKTQGQPPALVRARPGIPLYTPHTIVHAHPFFWEEESEKETRKENRKEKTKENFFPFANDGIQALDEC